MASQPSERSPYEPASRPALQFSLTALFILTTVFALALSAFFGISQFFGLSALELLATSFGHFLHSVPRIIVWSVGLAMAIRRLRTYRRPAILAAVALSGFIVAILLMRTIQIVVIAGMNSGQIATVSVSWIFGATSLIYTLIDVVGWILILMAIFSDRPIARSPFDAQADIVDPFSQDEPITGAGIDEETPFG